MYELTDDNFFIFAMKHYDNPSCKGMDEFKDDLKRFYKITTQEYPEGNKNICIMGYNTWLSIPENVRPFKNRMNIIVTKSPLFEKE